MYPPENKIWPIHIFDNYELKEFENIKVRVPAGWDEQLKIYFGDYMKFPPKEERGSWHNIEIMNPDVPFIKHKEMLIGGGQFLRYTGCNTCSRYGKKARKYYEGNTQMSCAS